MKTEKYTVSETGMSNGILYVFLFQVESEEMAAICAIAISSLIHRKDSVHKILKSGKDEAGMDCVNGWNEFVAACLAAESGKSTKKEDRDLAAEVYPKLVKADEAKLKAVQIHLGLPNPIFIGLGGEDKLARQFANKRKADEIAKEAAKAAALSELLG